ncbi:unnamed protein product [Tilletia laevis]|uniref:Uncharacterized protein n=1 Tax=Tilletia laevis TaxID=157183 RepID=A0A9N8LSW8_9BASI|nr:unnamed protein product [Tilletia laevis]
MRGPTDGKRKAVSILKGVSSSEGAGSLRPPKRTVKKVVDLEFVHLWLLSKEACRRAAEKDTGFKKPMGFTSNGTFVDEDESRPDGYIPEGNLDWLLWGQCTTMPVSTYTNAAINPCGAKLADEPWVSQSTRSTSQSAT